MSGARCARRRARRLLLHLGCLVRIHPNPDKRYAELSELLFDLRNPSPEFLSQARPPLIERNPAAFWKGVSAILALIIVLLLRRLP